MPEPTTPGMTPVDAMLCDDSLQTLKACIPYMRPKEQPLFLLAAKALELSHAVRVLQGSSQSLAACSVEPALRTPVHMLNQIKRFCSSGQRENIDSILNVFQMMQLLQMAQSSPEQGGESPAWMQAALSPEQQQLFRSFSQTVLREQGQSGTTGPSRPAGREEAPD